MATTTEPDAGNGPILPDELLAARDRQARHRARAGRAGERQRLRRRYLPAALVGASVLSLAGVADKLVSASVANQRAAASTTTLPATTTTTTPASAATLAQVAKTLSADRQAIAALAAAEAALAAKAGGSGGSGGSGTGALPSLNLPSLPSLPSASSISVPPAPAAPAPATHATTGASVVVP